MMKSVNLITLIAVGLCAMVPSCAWLIPKGKPVQRNMQQTYDVTVRIVAGSVDGFPAPKIPLDLIRVKTADSSGTIAAMSLVDVSETEARLRCNLRWQGSLTYMNLAIPERLHCFYKTPGVKYLPKPEFGVPRKVEHEFELTPQTYVMRLSPPANEPRPSPTELRIHFKTTKGQVAKAPPSAYRFDGQRLTLQPAQLGPEATDEVFVKIMGFKGQWLKVGHKIKDLSLDYKVAQLDLNPMIERPEFQILTPFVRSARPGIDIRSFFLNGRFIEKDEYPYVLEKDIVLVVPGFAPVKAVGESTLREDDTYVHRILLKDPATKLVPGSFNVLVRLDKRPISAALGDKKLMAEVALWIGNERFVLRSSIDVSQPLQLELPELFLNALNSRLARTIHPLAAMGHLVMSGASLEITSPLFSQDSVGLESSSRQAGGFNLTGNVLTLKLGPEQLLPTPKKSAFSVHVDFITCTPKNPTAQVSESQ